jgi:hypothetical protein
MVRREDGAMLLTCGDSGSQGRNRIADLPPLG